jgi:hypothetical protein
MYESSMRRLIRFAEFPNQFWGTDCSKMFRNLWLCELPLTPHAAYPAGGDPGVFEDDLSVGTCVGARLCADV